MVLRGAASDNSSIRGIWIDGAGATYRGHTGGSAVNVHAPGIHNFVLEGNRISGTPSWSTVVLSGKGEGRACSNNVVVNNVVTVYTSAHHAGLWADGISASCEDSRIHANVVMDATDVGIIAFRATGVPQRSKIIGNVVVNAGNSAYAALAADPLVGPPPADHDMVDLVFADNRMWTGHVAHVDILIAIGTRPWFAGGSLQVHQGWGASFIRNNTAGLAANGHIAYGVAGVHLARVEGRYDQFGQEMIRLTPTRTMKCAVAPGQMIVSPFHVNYAALLTGPYVFQDIDGCIGHFGP